MAPEKAKDITWVDVEFPEGPTYLFRLHAPDDGLYQKLTREQRMTQKPLPYLFEVGKKVQFKARRVPGETEGTITQTTVILDDFDATLAYKIRTENGREIKVREYDIIGAPEKADD